MSKCILYIIQNIYLSQYIYVYIEYEKWVKKYPYTPNVSDSVIVSSIYVNILHCVNYLGTEE